MRVKGYTKVDARSDDEAANIVESQIDLETLNCEIEMRNSCFGCTISISDVFYYFGSREIRISEWGVKVDEDK
jgi:hypothetical protein